LRQRDVPVRILSARYTGASDPTALEWLARQPNISVRVSYHTAGTRLHTEAYHFTILFFARLERRVDGETAPFVYLGPARALLSAEGDRPIRMVWELQHPMPAGLLEEAMPAG
jgi:hypothetical protein